MLAWMDIGYFRLADEKCKAEYFHIAVVEGAISSRHEAEKLKKIRENCKYLVAIGACAAYGGIPSLRNVVSRNRLYSHHPVSSSKTYGIDKYVAVDYYIRGCPIEKEEFAKVIMAFLNDRKPQHINRPVCQECVDNEIQCIMLRGEPCMGPITAMGCNALCPSQNTACEGCRGVIKDANTESLVKLFSKLGLDKRLIRNKLERFAAPLPEIKIDGDENENNKA